MYSIERWHQRNNGNGYWAIVEKETTTIVETILLKQLPEKDGLPTQDYEVGWHLWRASPVLNVPEE
ncbi:hypothetical protein IQ277_00730 [Nostocales cyanobacterium LEGE 12452]|nr:hypothetical protein [Nostocales cyanobacterium LEGE 12452]